MDYGLRILALRALDAARTHVRVTNLVFPHAIVIPLSAQMTITQWHVPIDDERCYWYAIFTSFDQPVDKQEMRRQRLELYTLPDYKPRVGRGNDYGFDAREQRTQTYTGMGRDINVHDQWAVESQGKIQDRTREHLGQTDKAIIAYRRMLDRAIDQVTQVAQAPLASLVAKATKAAEAAANERPLMVLDAAEAEDIRGPIAVDGIAASDDWEEYASETDAERRRSSSWASARALSRASSRASRTA